MIQKADIVTQRGLRSNKIGIVDKVIELEGKEYAVIRWIKPAPNERTFMLTRYLKTLRTAAEAASRGRKKAIAGLEEGKETYTSQVVVR
tara:strand:- start:393 stop:659 length:267 start_codon:yes stop_codon:yes gene_type:complete